MPPRTLASKAPAAGFEPAASRVTVARLTDSTTPERRVRCAHSCTPALSCDEAFRRGDARRSGGRRPPRSAQDGARRPSLEGARATSVQVEPEGFEPSFLPALYERALRGAPNYQEPAAGALSLLVLRPQTRAEGEGLEPSRPRGPPVFETGYRTHGSPSRVVPARIRTRTAPIKSRRLCR